MRLIWSRPALRDHERHFLYLAERNPAAAQRVDDAIRAAVERLIDQPHRGRPGQSADTRELVITEFPAYLICLSGHRDSHPHPAGMARATRLAAALDGVGEWTIAPGEATA